MTELEKAEAAEKRAYKKRLAIQEKVRIAKVRASIRGLSKLVGVCFSRKIECDDGTPWGVAYSRFTSLDKKTGCLSYKEIKFPNKDKHQNIEIEKRFIAFGYLDLHYSPKLVIPFSDYEKVIEKVKTFCAALNEK